MLKERLQHMKYLTFISKFISNFKILIIVCEVEGFRNGGNVLGGKESHHTRVPPLFLQNSTGLQRKGR